jgi:hypothetical protein
LKMISVSLTEGIRFTNPSESRAHLTTVNLRPTLLPL